MTAPCSEDWTTMAGDDRGRFCTRCAQTVHDLSAMTEADARTLLAGPAERLCVRFGVRRDGTVATRGPTRWFGRSLRALVVAVAAVVFWTGVTLLQRPWRALARRLAASTSPVPLRFEPSKDDEERSRAYDEIQKRLADSTRQLFSGSYGGTTMGTMSTAQYSWPGLKSDLPRHHPRYDWLGAADFQRHALKHAKKSRR